MELDQNKSDKYIINKPQVYSSNGQSPCNQRQQIHATFCMRARSAAAAFCSPSTHKYIRKFIGELREKNEMRFSLGRFRLRSLSLLELFDGKTLRIL